MTRPVRPSRRITIPIAIAATAAVLSGCAVDASAPAASGDTVTLGWLLPQTGPVAALGAPQIAALELAVADINEAGGAGGHTVELTGGDEAGDPAVAGQAVDRLLADGVPVIFGTSSSAITLSVIDKITSAGVVQCSGNNTSPALSDYPDKDLYFRTVPSDALQGSVLAERIAADGAKRVAILARSDSYGTGIADATEAALTEAGLEVATRVDYDPNAQNLDTEIRQVASAGTDAIVLFSFDEGAKILQGLIQAGAGPADVNLYGTDALPVTTLAESVDPANAAVLEGMTITQASSGEGSDFTDRLLEASPDLTTTAFAPYIYDCAVLTALAMEAAESTDPKMFAQRIVELTNGDTECTSYEECKELIADGTSVNYAGAAGPLLFSDNGEPTTGLYDILVMGADGTTTTVDTVRTSADG